MKIKFSIGDKVKHLTDGEISEVLSFAVSVVDGEPVTKYTISSKEVDVAKREILNGVKTVLESEIELVKEEADGE